MKNIYIITRQNINNYGSFLQSYATQEILKEWNYSVKIINYIPKDENFFNIIRTRCLINNKRGIKKIFYTSFAYPLYCYSQINFSILRNKYLNLTKKVVENNIHKLNADIFLSGSDQIWGGIGTRKYDINYFLQFSNSENKIAYSSSFGHTNFESIDQRIISALKEYKMIGAREQSGVDFLKTIGIDSKLVLDPVFLFDKKFYLKKIIETKKMKKDYILVYQIHKNSSFDKYVCEISRKFELPIFRIHNNPFQIIRPGKLKCTQNPFRFLGYLYNARYIITDSFHCVSFSVIFNKQFVSISPGETNTRIESLLNCLNIRERLIDFSDTETLSLPINYKKVNSRLDILKKDSVEFFKNELELAK